ncbi:hypothetical protein SULPSESMR1_04490 (plasmid) [Pseudosulfitobacter pseudonitzschiae]|uniref:Uncharacterized protein n=1 Tax=Pseudosulfitobacter pseudonitzschiae TaxID=1402135 RepID=A0A221K870_9RHOB|nr:hypothetical protein SULPSESMR1_04490 [Pseudosulfitobacter pseudonitzschiae]
MRSTAKFEVIGLIEVVWLFAWLIDRPLDGPGSWSYSLSR